MLDDPPDVTFWLAIIADDSAGDAAVTLEQASTFLGAARTDLVCDAEVLSGGRTVAYGTLDPA